MKNSIRTIDDVYLDFVKLSETSLYNSALLKLQMCDYNIVVNHIKEQLNSSNSINIGLGMIPFYIEKSIKYIDQRNTVENASNIFEEKAILNVMLVVFKYLLTFNRDINEKEFGNFFKIFRNKLIKDILNNPPLLNSTSPIQNLENVYTNSGKSKILQDFIEPMYNCLNEPSRSFDSFCSFDKNFPT